MTTNKFTDIDPKLSHESLEAISLFGFTTMTPVQSSTIPLFLQNKVMVINKDHDGDDDDVDDDDDDDDVDDDDDDDDDDKSDDESGDDDDDHDSEKS